MSTKSNSGGYREMEARGVHARVKETDAVISDTGFFKLYEISVS